MNFENCYLYLWSREIEIGCRALVRSPWEGPIWAYADWADNILEDAAFRLATPAIRRGMSTRNQIGETKAKEKRPPSRRRSGSPSL